jgi:tetratricopeptide (TPR) repeat protein
MEDYCCGIKYYEEGDLDKARSVFNKLLSNNAFKGKPNVYRWLGIIELSVLNYEGASHYFKCAIDEGSEVLDKFTEPACREKDKDALAWAYHDYGYTLLAQNDLGEAKIYLKKAMDLAPGKAWFINDLGYCCYKLEDWKNADTMFNTALKEEKNGYTHILLGRTYYKEGNEENALMNYNEAFQIFLKKINKRNLKEIEQLFKEDGIDKQKIGNILQIVNILNNKSQIELDHEAYSKAQDLLLDARTLGELIQNYIESNDTFLPIEKKTYKESIATTCNNLGLLFYKKGLYEASKKEYERGLMIYELPEIYHNLGILYQELGDEKLSEKFLKIAHRIDPRIRNEKAKDSLSESKGDAPSSWWDWWFGNSKRFHRLPISARFWVGSMLILACALFIINLAYVSLPSTDTITNETTQKFANNITSVYKHAPVSIESKIIILAVLLFVLFFPQIKSFAVKDVKFELEPISKGSGGKQLQN